MAGDTKVIYDRLTKTMLRWADTVPFRSRDDNGRLIGPFNPVLYSPEVASGFLDMQAAERQHSSLPARVREVVILSVGAVWRAEYELYAHAAAARQAGMSEATANLLAQGEICDDLSADEKVAQQFSLKLASEHRVEDQLFEHAKRSFGLQGVVDMAILIGNYCTTCALLNAFNIPAPGKN